MGLYAAGQVVFLQFPFSDLSRSKLRPVLLLAYAGQREWLSAQITSNPYIDLSAIPLPHSGFSIGSLQHLSYVRPVKLFTAHETIMGAPVGVVTSEIMLRAQDRIIAAVRQMLP